MRPMAVLLFCLAPVSAAIAQAPALHSSGGAEQVARGDLTGFRPIRTVWPDVVTDRPNGSRVSVSFQVTAGKPYEFRVTGSPNQTAEPFLEALKQWRFSMPADGTTPVSFAVIWEARNGKFIVERTEIGVQ